MKRISLISVAVFFLMAAQAMAEMPPWLSSIEILPEKPTSRDVVAITLSGTWADMCAPNASAVVVMGNDIYFDVSLDYPPDSVCAAVPTPWALTECVGPLSPGTYAVYTALIPYGVPWPPEMYTYVTQFTVAEISTYVFVPERSTVIESGGYAGVYETYTIEGQFELAVDFDAGVAWFEQVDANLSQSVLGSYGRSLDDLFDMTELVGTVVSATEIDFDTAPPPLLGSKVVHIDLTLKNGWAELTGGFCEPWPDGFCYNIDAAARKKLDVYDISWIPGEVSPADWSIAPNSPTNRDVINFSGPTPVFANWCVAEGDMGDTPTLTIDPVNKTIELWFQPPPPDICPNILDPVCGLEGSFGPLDGGAWLFFGNEPNAAFAIPFEVTAEVLVFYVHADDGNDLNDGLSPETAFATIQRGIDATVDGDTVIVAQGTYVENTYLNGKNIVLTGTAPMDMSVVNNTVIDGNDANSVVTFSGTETSDCVLSGFTITNGYAHDGGGIYGNGTMATIQNNIIKCNTAERTGIPGARGYGGGLYDCDGLIQYNIIRANEAGGGMGTGGGLYGCDGNIVNCLVSENSAVVGGGIYVDGDHFKFDYPTIINCTFSGNIAVYGGAIFCAELSSPTMVNCILWGDNAANGPEIGMTSVGFGSWLSVSFSDVEGGQGAIYDVSHLYWEPGNMDADPLFVSPGEDDYHLLLGSPCVDAGDPNYPDDPNETDLDGNPRVINGTVDMGAYEFSGLIYVDDDAPNDPGPGDPNVSDPNENGSEAHPFDTIQEAIDVALDGHTVLVWPGLYLETDPLNDDNIDFLGKNIKLTSAEPTDSNVVENTIIRGYIQFSGTEDANCTLTGFTIRDPYDGAIYGNHTQATISHCIITGNRPSGATVIVDCDGTISNCLITDNRNCEGCGLLLPAVFGCHGLIKNCTIANNASGIVAFGGNTMTMENCIIFNNGGPYQVEVELGSTLNISYCNLQGGLQGIAGGGTVNWGMGNIDTDPCFVRLGYWQGEPLELVEGNYHLKSEGWRWRKYVVHGSHWTYDYVTSRCIDAGNPGCALADEVLAALPDDPNNQWGVNLRVNMGAYGGTPEASMAPHGWAFLPDLTNDGIVALDDLAGQTADWLKSKSEQPGDLNRDGVVNMVDYAILAADWLQATDWIK